MVLQVLQVRVVRRLVRSVRHRATSHDLRRGSHAATRALVGLLVRQLRHVGGGVDPRGQQPGAGGKHRKPARPRNPEHCTRTQKNRLLLWDLNVRRGYAGGADRNCIACRELRRGSVPSPMLSLL